MILHSFSYHLILGDIWLWVGVPWVSFAPVVPQPTKPEFINPWIYTRLVPAALEFNTRCFSTWNCFWIYMVLQLLGIDILNWFDNSVCRFWLGLSDIYTTPGLSDVLISHKVFLKSFCESRFPHDFFNLFFILIVVKDKWTDLRRSWFLRNDFKGTVCKIDSHAPYPISGLRIFDFPGSVWHEMAGNFITCCRETVLFWRPTGPNPHYHRDDQVVRLCAMGFSIPFCR